MRGHLEERGDLARACGVGTIVCLLVTTVWLVTPAPAAAQRRADRIAEAAGASGLGLVIGAALGGMIGGVTGALNDRSGFGPILGVFYGAPVGAWIAEPSMIALVATDAAQVGWAWLGHLVSTIVGAVIGLASWGIGEATHDVGVLLAGQVAGSLVAISGAPVGFALSIR